MKLAEIVPLFKKGDPHQVDNYRPISLLITISKILEKLMYKRVYNFLDNTTQIYSSQYGFRKQHSCEHAVQELVGNILKGKEKHEHSIGIFLDLSKAFDMLKHSTLLKKLEIYGVRGSALDWFTSYLSGRKMRVRCTVNGKNDISTQYEVNYGVPQGSCLGPLLFLVFCNDLHLNLEFTKCILFADDTTIYNSHKDLRYLTWSLEHDLGRISDWFKANKLTLNTLKSVCILFKANNKPMLELRLKLGEEEIQTVDSTKFLGIWLDKDLSWDQHVSSLILKIQRNSQMLYRTKNILNCHAKKILYFAQIYSHLSYGIGNWGPMTKNKLLRKLHSIQASALSCISPSAFSKFLNVNGIVKLELIKFGWKIQHYELPLALQKCAQTDLYGTTLNKSHRYTTPNKSIPYVPAAINKKYKSSIFSKSIKLLSSIPHGLRDLTKQNCFF